jgi:hypothetical protein
MRLVSLIGEQPIPNLLPVRSLKPDETLLVYTQRTEAVARRLRKLISNDDDLNADLRVEPYEMEKTLQKLQQRLQNLDDVVFNLTGGTKIMLLAAYTLALHHHRPFIYLESERKRSLLRRYEFENGAIVSKQPEEIKTIINIDDYLRAHLPGYRLEGYHRDKNGSLDAGGHFEKAVYHVLQSRVDEVVAGIRPEGMEDQIEIDLAVRIGNQVGIIELKTGGEDAGKRALDQLKMAAEPTYLGTYTKQFLITASTKLKGRNDQLAQKRNITVIHLPNYQHGQPLNKDDAERLAKEIHLALSG